MKNLGFTGKITDLIQSADYDGFHLARVIVEHKERYLVQTSSGIFNAEITGNLRYSAKSRLDFPAVGDWVKITMMDDETAVVTEILPRLTILERQATGKYAEKQIIATNIDFAFVVQSVGHDFNLKRLERYLAICYSSNIEPIILLTKTDLIEQNQIQELTEKINERIKGVPVVPLSIENDKSFDSLNTIFEPFKTYCFVGSSGVGKSTIINRLKGDDTLKTSAISSSTSKGKHTTTHRELIILPNGSIVIDTPGMREIGMTDNQSGVEKTYDEILELSKRCKFNDCSHVNEIGCAVLEALENGNISQGVYENFQKLRREQMHFTSSLKEKRRKSKAQGKMFKAVKAERKKNKF